jgi:hypothetical protein
MMLLVMQKKMTQHALLRTPQVRRWQLHMFPLTRLALQFMPYRLSIEPPAPLTPMLP